MAQLDIGTLSAALVNDRLNQQRSGNVFLGAGQGLLSAGRLPIRRKEDIVEGFLASALSGLVGGGLSAFGEQQAQANASNFSGELSRALSSQDPTQSLAGVQGAGSLVNALNANEQLQEAERMKVLQDLAFKSSLNPRERFEGNDLVQEVFDPNSEDFQEVGRGARFKPSARAVGASPENASIDLGRADIEAARKVINQTASDSEFEAFTRLSKEQRKAARNIISAQRGERKVQIDEELLARKKSEKSRPSLFTRGVIPDSALREIDKVNSDVEATVLLLNEFLDVAEPGQNFVSFFNDNAQRLQSIAGLSTLTERIRLNTGARLEASELENVLSGIPLLLGGSGNFLKALIRGVRGQDQRDLAKDAIRRAREVSGRTIFGRSGRKAFPKATPLNAFTDRELKTLETDRFTLAKSLDRDLTIFDFPVENQATITTKDGREVIILIGSNGEPELLAGRAILLSPEVQ